MRRNHYTCILILLLTCLVVVACSSNEDKGNSRACFTPGEDCTGRVVEAIKQSQKTLLIQSSQFNNIAILQALLDAKQRGVDCRIIFDKAVTSAHATPVQPLLEQKIPLWIDNKVALAHNNVMIIDNEKVLTGSFTYTAESQDKNAENLIEITDPVIAKRYADNWQSRVVLSEAVTEIQEKPKTTSQVIHPRRHHLARNHTSWFSEILK